MTRSLSAKNILLIFLAVALILVSGRLVKSGFRPSYFITAGADHVDATKTPAPVVVYPGQGYDGQFFYRYALDPFDVQQKNKGVNVDHPAYRIQRIAYPFIAWMISLGGIPAAVPWALILLNVLAFAGISFYTGRFIALMDGSVSQGLLPLLLCGIYMSLARNLSEVVELFFFTGSVYYLFRQKYFLLSLFATLTILTRETSMIALLPLLGGAGVQIVKRRNVLPLVWLGMPFVVFAIWKTIIYTSIPSVADATAGYGSVGLPFMGIIRGFMVNADFTNTHNILQFLFWIMYLAWQIAFGFIVFARVPFRGLFKPGHLHLLKLAYLCWLVFAICFSAIIYCDDWGFVRIFSMWNMIGFLLLIAHKQQTGRLFNAYSALLVLMTIARLIIRV